MKRYKFVLFPIIIGLILVCFLIFNISEKKAVSTDFSSGQKVIIDAGHGGVDGGAVSSDGTVEKNINLKIALKTKALFEIFGYQVIMTRESDVSIHDDTAVSIREQKTSDLHNRLDIANQNSEALLISIHQNKYSSQSSKGMQVFYSGNNGASKLLADSIQEFTVKNLDFENDRSTKEITKDVYLIYNAKQPAVLVECGFLSNPKEAQLLKSDEYQSSLAFCIFGGTADYCK